MVGKTKKTATEKEISAAVEQYANEAIEEAPVGELLLEVPMEIVSKQNGLELLRQGAYWAVQKNGRVLYTNSLKENAERFLDCLSKG